MTVRSAVAVGQRFGRLEAISHDGRNRYGRRIWKCRCECGRLCRILASSLSSGHTRSCGSTTCRRFATTHGQSQLPEYRIWLGVIMRCENRNEPAFPRYGGRGILLCSRWRNSFPCFLEDVGKRPSERHTLERIDNNGNYEPSNVRWATRKEQSHNTRRNRFIAYGGRSQCVTAWAEELGINPRTLFTRLDSGWSIADAFSTPVPSATRRRRVAA